MRVQTTYSLMTIVKKNILTIGQTVIKTMTK